MKKTTPKKILWFVLIPLLLIAVVTISPVEATLLGYNTKSIYAQNFVEVGIFVVGIFVGSLK